jgi:hypothetical protein
MAAVRDALVLVALAAPAAAQPVATLTVCGVRPEVNGWIRAYRRWRREGLLPNSLPNELEVTQFIPNVFARRQFGRGPNIQLRLRP